MTDGGANPGPARTGAMLGPNDILDWGEYDGDRLRAEIRLLPLVRRFRAEPRPVAAILGRELLARLRAFDRNADLAPEQLRVLLADLRRASVAAR